MIAKDLDNNSLDRMVPIMLYLYLETLKTIISLILLHLGE